MPGLPSAQRMDPRSQAASNMISYDSSDPSKFLDLLTTVASLAVGGGDAAGKGIKALGGVVKKKAKKKKKDVTGLAKDADVSDTTGMYTNQTVAPVPLYKGDKILK